MTLEALKQLFADEGCKIFHEKNPLHVFAIFTDPKGEPASHTYVEWVLDDDELENLTLEQALTTIQTSKQELTRITELKSC